MMIKLAWRTTNDPLVKLRALWVVLGLAMSSLLIMIGGGYAFAGEKASLLPKAFTVILWGGHLPGGIRTHGWILVLLGASQLWGCAGYISRETTTNWFIVHWSAVGICGYSFWCAWAFFGATWITHHYLQSMWWFLFVSVLAGAKVILPPPRRIDSKHDSSHSKSESKRER